MSPPGTQPDAALRSHPGERETALELRTATGEKALCTLHGAQITLAIESGLAELVHGSHGRYLRALVKQPDPIDRQTGRFTAPKTWIGRMPRRGGRTSYRHNSDVCKGFGTKLERSK